MIIERGAAWQRARFLKTLALSMLMDSRFQPSLECVELARRAVAASEEANNLAEAVHVNFVLGLIELFHGDLRDAAEQCGKAFRMAERTGDLVLQARCLTYRAVAYRRLGDVPRCRTEAEKTLVLAAELKMVEYVAMAKASLAWVAWREKNEVEAEKLATEALELWHGMDDPYGFDWMALWPLIAIALLGKILQRCNRIRARFAGRKSASIAGNALDSRCSQSLRTMANRCARKCHRRPCLSYGVARELSYL